jgi:hypothetical protein
MTTDAANGFIACGRAPRIGPARRLGFKSALTGADRGAMVTG